VKGLTEYSGSLDEANIFTCWATFHLLASCENGGNSCAVSARVTYQVAALLSNYLSSHSLTRKKEKMSLYMP
jgi:hypothetical protein